MHEISNVINNGLCIGCGACSLGKYDNIELDQLGRYIATTDAVPKDDYGKLDAICPFSNASLNEDELTCLQEGESGKLYDSKIGHFTGIWTGYVNVLPYRNQGSSGGVTSWLLNALLSHDLIDAVVHAKPSRPEDKSRMLFNYQVSRSSSEINLGAKSHYYPVELSEVLAHIRHTPGRYALVVLPCFAKSIRSLMQVEPVFKERIAFLIGLFCGHLKSTGFAELLAYQAGVNPSTISSIDFRTKIQGKKASDYGFTVSDGLRGITKPMSEVIGRDWGMGLFKYKACDFCDDVFAEVADVSIGDAWLPEFNNDSNGTNILIARNKVIHNLITKGLDSGELILSSASVEMAHHSQAANIRHRREDLPYRLYVERKLNGWTPRKRIRPSADIPASRKAIQDIRGLLRDRVPLLWAQYKTSDDKSKFFQRLTPLIRKYQSLYHPQASITRRLQMKLRIRSRLRELAARLKTMVKRPN